jgi:hypothetical protein
LKSSSFFSDDVYETTARTPSPGKSVEFFIDNHRNSKQSISPGSLIDTVIESSEQDKVKMSIQFSFVFLFILF